MRYLFVCIAALSLTVAGCKSNQQKAVELNNKLAAISDSLYQRGISLGTAIQTSSATRNFSKVAESGKQMEVFIDKKIEEVNKMENVAGSEKYKEAVSKFLSFEKKLIQDALLPFGKLDKNSSDEELNNAIQNLVSVAKDEQKYLNDVRTSQREFAEKNKITLLQRPGNRY